MQDMAIPFLRRTTDGTLDDPQVLVLDLEALVGWVDRFFEFGKVDDMPSPAVAALAAAALVMAEREIKRDRPALFDAPSLGAGWISDVANIAVAVVAFTRLADPGGWAEHAFRLLLFVIGSALDGKPASLSADLLVELRAIACAA